jgi:protein-L-isoaspartate(D-aspartate) O-methyltransferase
MTDFATAKHNMIEQQIRPWEVLDPRVLEVFDRIDRDHFVPEQYKGLAYADCQLPVIDGESMLPPTVEGRMLQALDLNESDNVLQIGTCSGYLTACLASLCQNVTSVDLNAQASSMAHENLDPMGFANIELHTIASLNDITHVERYDAIAVTGGSLTTIPENLKQALVIGGRLFVITGNSPVMHAQLMTRLGQNEWSLVNLFETDIPAL